jgi:hypothetical protein
MEVTGHNNIARARQETPAVRILEKISSSRHGVIMGFHQRASAAADLISLVIDGLMANRPFAFEGHDDDLVIEVSALVDELTARRPRIMQLILEHKSVRESFENTLSRIPATRPKKRRAI